MLIYRIGDLAKEAGVTVRTIRYYEELGLIDSPDREGSEQRKYSERDLLYLKRIIQLKSYGLSLVEIGELIRLGREDPSGEKRKTRLLMHYREKMSDALAKRDKIELYIEELKWHVEQLEQVDDFQACPGAACKNCNYRDKCRFIPKEGE